MSKFNDAQTAQDLAGAEAISKLKEIAEKARNCMMVTNPTNFPSLSRPMSLQEVDEKGSLYFISAKDSEKNSDIEADDRIALYFQNNSSYDFLSVQGHAKIHTDKTTIDKYWTDFANAWFEGKDDPNVSIIEVVPEDCRYWETKDGKIVSLLKMSFAALTGKSMKDGGVEGSLNV